MLRTVKTAILLTKDKGLADMYMSVAPQCEVSLTVREDWDIKFRVTTGVVLCDSDMAELVAEEYRCKTVIILKNEANFVPWRGKFERFVFNRFNRYELIYSFLEWKPDLKKEVKKLSSTMTSVINESGLREFVKGDYDFNFEHDLFKYKGKSVYLSKTEKLLVARWLLLGYKDNNTRTHIYRIRKRLGSEFLADINKRGELKNEQWRKGNENRG